MENKKKKAYIAPTMEIIPVDIQNILVGSAPTEDFNKEEFDWDADPSSSTEKFEEDEFSWED